MSLYVLDELGEKPVRCDDWEKWAHWFEDFELRRVNVTLVGGSKLVSTVFLGVDHGGGLSDDHPVLWECMVFDTVDKQIGGSLDYDRCCGTREQALAMHAAMVERVEAMLALDEGIPLEA